MSSLLSIGKDKIANKPPSQILVSVLNPLSPKNTIADVEGTNNISTDCPPSITLEVPSFNYGKCLSPIKELPTPLPTPCPSPLPTPLMPRIENCLSQSENSGLSDSSISISSSVSRSSSFRKLMNKAKTIPVVNKIQNCGAHINSVSVSNDSYDSGEGTMEQPEISVSDYSEISIPIPCFRYVI